MYRKTQMTKEREETVKQEEVTTEEERMFYHDKEEPRVFKKGEDLPAGWGAINGHWRQDREGKWLIDKG